MTEGAEVVEILVAVDALEPVEVLESLEISSLEKDPYNNIFQEKVCLSFHSFIDNFVFNKGCQKSQRSFLLGIKTFHQNSSLESRAAVE